MAGAPDVSKLSDEQLDNAVFAARRLKALRESRRSLIAFSQLTMPDPEHPNDAAESMYQVGPHHRLLAEVFEKAVLGTLGGKNVAVSMPPQHGKSQQLTRNGPAWALGKKPWLQIMVGSYNEDKAMEFGNEVNAIMDQPTYGAIFPDIHRTEKSASSIAVRGRGRASFVGVGGSGTGKPADIFIVDDPIKNDEDARSEAYREKLWNWYTKVVNTRCHNKSTILVVQTRWHEDDLIGRLCDPNHPERKGRFEGSEEDWVYIDLPAVVTDPALAETLGLTLTMPTSPAIIKQFGERPMVALWEDRQNLERHARSRRLDRVGFDALFMGKPSPDEGIDFKDTMMSTYRADELPKNLIYYGASDHATGIKQTNDPNCLGCVGIDEKDNIYVLPDLVWKRQETDKTIESMLSLMARYKPYVWWMENELISKSFGPFLKKRMVETKTYCTLDPVTVAVDKKTRSRAIHARMSMNKVLFPVFAPWWEAAKSEMLRFPNGAHDDFVDWLAHIGNGLAKQYSASKEKSDNDNVIVTGSLKWILADTKRKARQASLTDSLWLSGRKANV
jgi:predicted phage terminase large subunit-like protein